MVPVVLAAVTLVTLAIRPALTAEVTHFDVPRGAHPHDVAPAPDGSVWYTAQSQGAIGILNTKTGRTNQIGLGIANAILRFDPASETFESFPSDRRGASVRQLLGRPGEVWGAESGVDQLVVVRE